MADGGGMSVEMNAALAFLRTRWLACQLRTADGLHKWQSRRLAIWLRDSVPRVGAFAGQKIVRLRDVQPTDKAILMASFSTYNRAAVTAAEVRAAIDAALADMPPLATQKPSIGCNIKWIADNGPDYFSADG